MRNNIKFILSIIILLFTSNLIGQTIVEGSEESKFLKRGSDVIDGHFINIKYYKGELFNGKQLGYYGNRQLKREQNYKNGKLFGLAKGWYENGKLKFEENTRRKKGRII